MNNSVRFSFLQDVASLKADDWLTRQAGARAMVASAIGHQLTTQSDSKMDAVAMASPAGALQARPGFKISQQLFQREDTGLHLDYAGPSTHPPSHN
jgi:hypothetical protein